MAQPFWKQGEFKVPDNWWHDESYVNVPLDVFYAVVRDTAAAGESLVFGGDVSEPGLWGLEDVAIVPSFDIPGASIDQEAREFRFYNRTSTDDHLVHVVGFTELGGHDWFLIKDSNRSSRAGKHEGYYFFRDDYIKLKLLALTVHRDRVAAILERVDDEGR
jgi:bleomycin hydrolase